MTACELAPRFPWYALKVRARSEPLVRKALERKAYETFLPTYKEARQYSDRVKKDRRSSLPRIFILSFRRGPAVARSHHAGR